MSNPNKDVIDVLNDLIEYSKDGEKGFKASADDVKNPELKAFFVQRAGECANAAGELQSEVRRLGGDPETSTSISGDLHRGWVNLKSMVTGKDARMLIRSLTLTTLLALAGPLLAADGDSPLDIDKGRARPLIVITSSTIDPVWLGLKKSLDDPANKEGLAQRNIRVYSVLNMSGQLDGKDMGQQDTMALIRSLKLGAGALPKVILVGKDGEKKLESSGDESKTVDLKKIFETVDAMPMAEKEAAAAAAATPPPAAAEPAAAKGTKATKPAKPAKPTKPPEMPDD